MQTQEPLLLPETNALPEKPTLYFVGWGYDERKDKASAAKGANVLVVETAGETFFLRKIRELVIFRRSNDTDERAAWFLSKPYVAENLQDIKHFPSEKFAEEYAKQAYGRCLLYVGSPAQREECGFVCVSPQIGFSSVVNQDEIELVRFFLDDMTEMSFAEWFAADPEALRPVCKMVFKLGSDTFRLRTDNNFRAMPIQQITRRFLSGSEQELRRLTTIILQTEPELFDESLNPFTVIYCAQTPLEPARMMNIQCPDKYGYMRDHSGHSSRLQYLGDLALRFNTFVGLKWVTRALNSGYSTYDKKPDQVRVLVQPPSAHERAESLLSLFDWLEGKVSEKERLRLLGLEEG